MSRLPPQSSRSTTYLVFLCSLGLALGALRRGSRSGRNETLACHVEPLPNAAMAVSNNELMRVAAS